MNKPWLELKITFEKRYDNWIIFILKHSVNKIISTKNVLEYKFDIFLKYERYVPIITSSEQAILILWDWITLNKFFKIVVFPLQVVPVNSIRIGIFIALSYSKLFFKDKYVSSYSLSIFFKL